MAGATRLSLRVVKDHTESVTVSAAYATDAVPQVDAVYAARSLHRPMMDCEDHSIATLKWHDFRSRLHARPLFGDDELAASEIVLGLRQQNCNL
jgi:hypothetical protein